MIPDEWLALGGQWSTRVGHNADSFVRNESVLLVEQRIAPAVKLAGWVPVTNELLDDVAGQGDVIGNMMFDSLDRIFRPWLYPRVTPWPTFDPFPHWTRFLVTIRDWRGAIHRLWWKLPVHRGCTLDHESEDW